MKPKNYLNNSPAKHGNRWNNKEKKTMVKQVLKTVYELDEVKNEAIEKNRYINVDDFNDWYDFIFYNWKEKLEKIGFCNAEIHFSGFYSQGDGACFDNDSHYFDLDLLLKNVDLAEEERERIYSLKGDFELTIERSISSGHYCHEHTRYINIDCLYIDNKDDETLLNKFENLLEELRESLCIQIYQDLKNEYYYLTSDDAVYETLQANGYLFEENGDIANI
jgi:hypothetical protein